MAFPLSDMLSVNIHTVVVYDENSILYSEKFSENSNLQLATCKHCRTKPCGSHDDILTSFTCTTSVDLVLTKLRQGLQSSSGEYNALTTTVAPSLLTKRMDCS